MTDYTFKQHYYVQEAHVVDFTPKPRVFRNPQITTAAITIQTEPLCCYECHTDSTKNENIRIGTKTLVLCFFAII